jgi:hypothetical protein
MGGFKATLLTMNTPSSDNDETINYYKDTSITLQSNHYTTTARYSTLLPNHKVKVVTQYSSPFFSLRKIKKNQTVNSMQKHNEIDKQSKWGGRGVWR